MPRTLCRVVCGLREVILSFCPYLMKALSIVGTAATFLVGGGIIIHGVDFLHHYAESVALLNSYPVLLGTLLNLVVGVIVGAIVLTIINCSRPLVKKLK